GAAGGRRSLRRALPDRPPEGEAEGPTRDADVRSRLLVRGAALPAARAAARLEARPRRRRRSHRPAAPGAGARRALPAAARDGRAGEPGADDHETRRATAWLA